MDTPIDPPTQQEVAEAYGRLFTRLERVTLDILPHELEALERVCRVVLMHPLNTSNAADVTRRFQGVALQFLGNPMKKSGPLPLVVRIAIPTYQLFVLLTQLQIVFRHNLTTDDDKWAAGRFIRTNQVRFEPSLSRAIDLGFEQPIIPAELLPPPRRSRLEHAYCDSRRN